jgi:hypothetical protein
MAGLYVMLEWMEGGRGRGRRQRRKIRRKKMGNDTAIACANLLQ